MSFNLIKIWQLIQGTSLQDGHELPISEGEETGKTKKYSIGQLKAYIWTFVSQQIEGITKGDQGVQGVQGQQGLSGEKGEKGDKGDQGLKGNQGNQGLQGLQGIQGAKGDKGDKGDQGIQGFQGVPGEKGEKGDQGDIGEGVEPGGFTGQVLRKKTDDQFDTYWDDLPYVNVLDFGAVGDGVTDDTEAIAAAIAAGKTILFPKTDQHYRAIINNSKSNITLIFEPGVVIDGGVVHLAVGVGPGIEGWAPGDPIQYVENIRVIGKLATTQRVGTYYAKNLFFDEIEIVEDKPEYLEQTADGGSRGVHFYWGTENVFANKITSRSTKIGEPGGGVFIDAKPDDIDLTAPKNYFITDLIVEASQFDGIRLYEVSNVNFGNVVIKQALFNGVSLSGVDNVSISTLNISNAGECSLIYENSENVTIQNFISNDPGDEDVNNLSGENINIGYNQDLAFATDPFLQTGFAKLNLSSYNDLKDRPIVSGVLSDNLEIGSGVYGLLKIKGSAGALIDYYKGSTLLGEMGMEEVDSDTSQYKFYTRSGGTTVNILTLLGDKILLKLVSEHTNNAAAVAAGLPLDTLYRTGDLLKIVH